MGGQMARALQPVAGRERTPRRNVVRNLAEKTTLGVSNWATIVVETSRPNAMVLVETFPLEAVGTVHPPPVPVLLSALKCRAGARARRRVFKIPSCLVLPRVIHA